MNKKSVTESFEINFLFDRSTLDDVIAGLKRIKEEHPEAIKIRLVQMWDGYEDCHEEIQITRLETDQEYEIRLKKEEEARDLKRQMLERKRAKAKARKAAQIARLEKKLAKLKEAEREKTKQTKEMGL